MNFGKAIEALKEGKCIHRSGWNGKGLFVCKQVPSEISSVIIPKMQSLPDKAKELLLQGEEKDSPIFYVNQMIIINTNTRTINSWVPSSSDVFAEDWEIIE